MGVSGIPAAHPSGALIPGGVGVGQNNNSKQMQGLLRVKHRS